MSTLIRQARLVTHRALLRTVPAVVSALILGGQVAMAQTAPSGRKPVPGRAAPAGFTVVESGGIYKVVPEADAKLQSGSSRCRYGSAPVRPGNQIVTQIFRLNHETANNLVPVLRPLISPNNTINVNPGNNSLVITDYADNLQRMARIIAALDMPNATDVEVIPLKHAIASRSGAAGHAPD
jgi:type II secretory pathway component GspD/PulD (secretin)